jgi:hypothetical protein
MARKALKDMNHSWTRSASLGFSARATVATQAFTASAVIYRYAGEHNRLMYGAVVTFEALTRDEQAELMTTASGIVADALLKAAGLRSQARLAGAFVIGVDLGAPIGDTGDIAGGRASGTWTLAFTAR